MRITLVFIMFYCAVAKGEIVHSVDVGLIYGAQWSHYSTKHLNVITSVSPKRAQQVIEHIEQYIDAATKADPQLIASDASKLTLIYTSSKRQYHNLAMPKTTQGFYYHYNDDAYVVAYDHQRSLSTLVHEVTHWLMQSTNQYKDSPVWHSEGLSEYMATFAVHGYGVTLGSVSQSRVKSVDARALFNVGEQPYATNSSIEGRTLFYARALLVTHYLHSTNTLRDQLHKYLTLLNTGEPVDEAFNKAFATTWRAFDKAVMRYQKLRQYTKTHHRFVKVDTDLVASISEVDTTRYQRLNNLVLTINSLHWVAPSTKRKMFEDIAITDRQWNDTLPNQIAANE